MPMLIGTERENGGEQVKILVFNVRRLTLLSAWVSFSIVASASLCEAASNERETSTKEDLTIPGKFAAEIVPEAYSFRPLTYAQYSKHRTAFLAKLQHLQTYMRKTVIRKKSVEEWEEKYQPTLLTRLICSSYPDVDCLREIYTDSYETFVEDQRFDELARESNLLLRTTALSFQKYLVTLEDRLDPGTATETLRNDLQELKVRLEKYSKGSGIGAVEDFCVPNAALDQMTEIDNVVKRLMLREQVNDLTHRIWRSYMQPKARLHLSTKLLSKIVDFELPVTEVPRVQPNARIDGTATAHDRIFVFSNPNKERAELGVAYRGRFTFCGTLELTGVIKRKTGLQMGLCQNTSKTFFLEQDAADSNPALSATSLIYAKTQRGKLFDKLVTPSLRKNVPKDPINDKIRSIIDTAVTELSSLIPSGESRLDQLTASIYYPRERRYSSSTNSIEIIVYSSRSGFLPQPLVLPPADFSDYDVTLHTSIRSNRCDGQSRIINIMKFLFSEEQVESVLKEVGREFSVSIDETSGKPVQVDGDTISVRLKAEKQSNSKGRVRSFKLSAQQNSPGSLTLVEEDADEEGYSEVIAGFIQNALKNIEVTLPNIGKVVSPSMVSKPTVLEGKNANIQYHDGYLSVRGNLSN